jgi:hypothetical protein
MANTAVIPVQVVRDRVAAINLRLAELKRNVDRIKAEEAGLTTERAILAKVEQMAVSQAVPVSPVRVRKGRTDKPTAPPGDHQAVQGDAIPDGKVATPIILQMIREKPGITSIQIMDALDARVTKTGPKGGRKFLADLIWELGHRKKLVRGSDGGLTLPEQGGES